MTSSRVNDSKSELSLKFNEMNFDENVVEDFTALKKWMKEQSQTIGSVINFGNDGGNTGENAVGGKESAKMNMAHNEEVLVDLYKRIYSSSGNLNATSVAPAALPGRVQKLEELLKKQASTLVHAEATAGQVPTWVIEKEDLPNWAKCLRSPTVTEMRKKLETGYDQFYAILDPTSYSLSGFLSAFSALVQVDGPVVFLISPRVASCMRLLIPVVILADFVNEAKIRNEPISVIITAPNLLTPDAFFKLSAIDKLINRKSKGMIEMGDGVVRNPASPLMTVDTASLQLNILDGRTVNYVIDASGDIASACASISRNAWQCGISLNHRTRSLVFVHEPVHDRVIEEFQKAIQAQNVSDWRVNAMSSCDFVSRHPESSNLLAGVNKLGAKLISTTADFSSPTVVYNLGLSTDLIALKEASLGHVLLLIPYRSASELCSLGNNFGIPDRVLIYSNCINTTTSLMKKLNASKVVVNSTIPHLHSELEFPWQVRCKNADQNKVAHRSASYTNLKGLQRCNQWTLLSSNVKANKLNQLFNLSNVPTTLLASILSYQVDAMRGSSMSIPITMTSGVSGIIIGDPKNASVSLLISAVSTCILRDNAAVIVSVGSDIQEDVKKNILACGLPDGLVGFTTVGNVADVKKISANWELAWVIQGEKEKISMDVLPTNSEARMLLVNNNSDSFPDYNCMLAIKNSFKSCFF